MKKFLTLVKQSVIKLLKKQEKRTEAVICK